MDREEGGKEKGRNERKRRKGREGRDTPSRGYSWGCRDLAARLRLQVPPVSKLQLCAIDRIATRKEVALRVFRCACSAALRCDLASRPSPQNYSASLARPYN